MESAESHQLEQPAQPHGIARLLPSENMEGSLQGIVLITSVLATLDEDIRTGEAMVAILATGLAFALAHAWALAMANSADKRAPLSARELLGAWRRESALLEAAFPPVMALVPAVLGWYSTETGLWIGLLVNIALLIAWGTALRRLTGGSWFQAMLAGLVSAAIGLLLAGLKVLVH